MKFPTAVKGLYAGKTEDPRIQFFRSVHSSNISYLLDLGLYLLMVEVLIIPYPAARFLSYMAGTTLSYILSVLWIFPFRNISNRIVEFGGFAAVGVLGALENILLMVLLKEILGMNHIHANILAGITVFFISFFIRKLLLFRKSKNE